MTFTTSETVATEGLLSVEYSGKTTPFSIARLLMSISPLLSQQVTAPDDAYWLAITSYEKALARGDPSINASELASVTFSVIERFDSTAALKYALDHRLTTLPASRAKRPK